MLFSGPSRRELLSRYGWIVFAIVIVLSGLAGIDFGFHWDEHYTMDSVLRTYARGNLLPIHYNYPSLLFWIGNSLALPKFLSSGLNVPETVAFVKDPFFRLLFRACLFLLAQLSCLWAFRIARAASLPRWGAVIAGLLVGLSFELHYHSRWIAPDALCAQWVILSIYFSLLYEMSPGEGARYQLASAAVVGLAAGTKYPAALFILPVLGSVGLKWRGWKRALGRALLIVVVFGAVFSLTTPGVVWDTKRLLAYCRAEHYHYSLRGHGGYSVVAGYSHFAQIVEYLASVALSPFPALAVLLFCLAIWGGARLIRRYKSLAFAALTGALYVAYFSQQVVMIVRNYLVLIPILSLFCAAGVVRARDVLVARRATYRLAAVGFCFLLAVNAGWLAFAAHSVLNRFQGEAGSQIHAKLLSLGKRAYLTPSVRELLTARQLEGLRDVVHDHLEAGDEIFFHRSDLAHPMELPANRRGLYQLLATGPFEVNIDYYPSWRGFDRVLILNESEFPTGTRPRRALSE